MGRLGKKKKTNTFLINTDFLLIQKFSSVSVLSKIFSVEIFPTSYIHQPKGRYPKKENSIQLSVKRVIFLSVHIAHMNEYLISKLTQHIQIKVTENC